MFASLLFREATPVLRDGDLLMRAPRHGDFNEWRQVRLTSRGFLKPYEPRWTEADLSARAFAARIRRGQREAALGSDYNFFIVLNEEGSARLVGGLTLSNVRRRAAQFVNLGYWMAQSHAGRGIMTRSVALVLPFVFDSLGLHRVHAACLPDNEASRKVLVRNGFVEEGYAENYLQIDGAWRDHALFGLTRERYERIRKA
ncbi:MAG TPA: GNAT family protein [Devosiaceae bacterium]